MSDAARHDADDAAEDERPDERGNSARRHADTAPGDQYDGQDIAAGVRGYLIGLALAALLTAASFLVLKTQIVWAPAIPIALIVFAVAQMGVHLVFFLTSPPGRTTPTTCWRWPSAC